MANYNIEVIVPRELINTRKLMRALENTTKNTLKNVKVDFDVTTQTWRNRPEFEVEQSGIEGSVSTDDDVYRYVNDGTRVRYATMSPDFSPKTAPNIIRSRAGSGRVLYVRKDRPRPGIEARNFDEVIAKKWARLYSNTLQRAIDAETR